MPGLRDDQVALFLKDMYKAEREGYEEQPTVYNQVYKVKTGVEGAGDKVTQILGAGPLTRHTVEGQDINFKAPVQGWEFLVKYWTYSDGIALTKEAVDDTTKLGNLVRELANTWGKQVRIAKEELGSGIFNDGGNTSGTWRFNGTHTGQTDGSGNLLYDSKPLFNLSGNTRSTKGGGSYYNSIAGLDITPSSFELIYNLHTATNNRDERDQVVKNVADTILVKPGADYFKAWRIVNSEKGLPGSDVNDANPYYKMATCIMWDYLTDTSPVFYVGKKQSPDFQFHERQNSEIRFFRDENNQGYKASITIRIGTLLKNFRVWSRGGGTSS